MSETIEFPIGRNYASYWTLVDGIRELYANMLDYAKMNPDAIEFHYDTITGRLHIANQVEEKMATHALVLGNSNKAEDEIGRFGEGMKMAYLALLREGREVITINVDEVWTPSFATSERFGVETLQVVISKSQKPVSNTVRHIIEVSPEEVREFMENTLTFHKYVHGVDPYYIKTDKGSVLLGSTMSGHIYVGGLLVTRVSDMDGIGMDIKPELAKLGRDRKSIDNEDESVVYDMLAAALEVDPEAMTEALKNNRDLRRSIVDLVGLEDKAIPEDADENLVATLIARRKLRDVVIGPLLKTVEEALNGGAKFIVSSYMKDTVMEAYGKELFIVVPYGTQYPLRKRFENQSFAEAEPLWFELPAEAVAKVRAMNISDAEKLELIGRISSGWYTGGTYNI